MLHQLQAIAEQSGLINPLHAVQWEVREGKVVHIFCGMTLDARPWETRFRAHSLQLDARETCRDG